jgi:hypothetical protein
MMITRLRGGGGARGLGPTSKTSITQSRGVCVPSIGSCTHHVPFRMRDPMITRRTILMRHPRRAPPNPTTTRADRRTPAASHVYRPYRRINTPAIAHRQSPGSIRLISARNGVFISLCLVPPTRRIQGITPHPRLPIA